MTPYRLEEDQRLRALCGQTMGDGRVLWWAVSAGELLDELAHRQIWRRGSAAEQCSLHGDRHYWERGGMPQGR